MNRERAARAYDLISEGFAELAMAVRENDQPAVAPVVPPSAGAAPAAYEEDPSAMFDEGYQPQGPVNLADQHVENTLSRCPTHDRPWEVKPGGVSKAGKSYNAFWKCGAKDESTRSGFCDKKPVKAWQDAHPASQAA